MSTGFFNQVSYEYDKSYIKNRWSDSVRYTGEGYIKNTIDNTVEQDHYTYYMYNSRINPLDYYEKNKRLSVTPFAESRLNLEKLADIFRTPSRWLCHDLFKKNRSFHLLVTKDSVTRTATPISDHLALKIIRIVFAIFLAIPGEIIGSLCMGLAYLDSAVQKRHQIQAETTPIQINERTIAFKSITHLFEENSNWGMVQIKYICNIENKEQPSKIEKEEQVPTHVYKDETYPCNSKGEIFNHDPSWVIRFKGLLLLSMKVPVRTIVRTAYRLAVAILTLTLVLPSQLLEGKVSLLPQNRKEWVKAITYIFIPIVYGLTLMFFAFTTLFVPYQGRSWFGKIERKYNPYATVNDFCDFNAPCFQRLGQALSVDGPEWLFKPETLKFLAPK